MSIDNFETWASNSYSEHFSVGNSKSNTVLKQSHHYLNYLLGLHSAFIVASSNEKVTLKLSGLSIFDPIEHKVFSGLRIPEQSQIAMIPEARKNLRKRTNRLTATPNGIFDFRTLGAVTPVKNQG